MLVENPYHCPYVIYVKTESIAPTSGIIKKPAVKDKAHGCRTFLDRIGIPKQINIITRFVFPALKSKKPPAKKIDIIKQTLYNGALYFDLNSALFIYEKNKIGVTSTILAGTISLTAALPIISLLLVRNVLKYSAYDSSTEIHPNARI